MSPNIKPRLHRNGFKTMSSSTAAKPRPLANQEFLAGLKNCCALTVTKQLDGAQAVFANKNGMN